MELFENGVGRPSNETLKKRRNFKVIIVIVVALILVGGGFTAYKLLSNSSISGKEKEAAVACNYPFSQSKCNGKTNATVKAIQQRLWNLGYYKGLYSSKGSAVDGIFGPKTTQAVKKFQKAKYLVQNGIVSGKTFDYLFSGQKYFTIQYSSGYKGMDSADENYQQKIVNGVSQKITTSKIGKKGYTQVGWVVTTTIGRYDYVVGCTKKDCRSGAKGHIYTSYNQSNGTYYNSSINQVIYPAVYNSGSSVSQTGWVKGQILKFTPKYCTSGYTYNKANSTCTKVSSTASNKNTSNTKTWNHVGKTWVIPKKYNHKNVKNAIGVQTSNNCLDFAEAYGVYILGATGEYGEKGSTKVSNRNLIGNKSRCDWTTHYGASNKWRNYSPTNLYKNIVKEINAGRPVVLYTPRKISSTTWRDHWVLIVGYTKGVTSVSGEDAFKQNILILDPADCSNKILAKSYLITNGYKGYLNPFGNSSGNGGWETYKQNQKAVAWAWPSADKARACK